MRAAALVVLAACNGTGTGDDTGSTEGAEVVSGVVVEVEDAPAQGDLWVAAAQVHFGLFFGEEVTVGETLTSSAVAADGTFELGLPEAPGPGALEPLSKNLAESLRGTLAWIVAFEDLDGDGDFDEGEPVRGGDMDRWLIYLDAVPDDTGGAFEAWPSGWSLVDLSLSGQYQPNRCLYDTTEPLTWMQEHGTEAVFEDLSVGLEVLLAGVAATLDVAGAAVGDGVVGLPYQHLFAGEDLDPVLDGELSAGRYAATLAEVPPDEHDVGGDPDWRYTYALLLPYADLDGDERYTLADDLDNATACHEGQRAYLRYTRRISTWRGYRFLECYGATVGWRAATTDPDSGAPLFLSSSQALELDLDPVGCPAW